MAYQMYRQTTLGTTLQESLNELIEDGTITKGLAERVLIAYDRCISNALANRARNKVNFKAEKLVAYRFCDNVWTFVMENVEFKDSQLGRPTDGVVKRLKIVACDASMPKKAS